jgi:DNA invertase Pin-like site-specific DNA recombinase
VETVTGNIDLRTSNGRALARVLVAVANKSSEDTARRVARARLQVAQEGNGSRFTGSRRRFGYREDGSLNEGEAALIRDAAKGSWLASRGTVLPSISGPRESGRVTRIPGQ